MNVKMKYSLLYKSGVEDVFEQIGEAEELSAINGIIEESFREGDNAVVTFGDSKNSGRYVRVSDLSRVNIEFIEVQS